MSKIKIRLLFLLILGCIVIVTFVVKPIIFAKKPKADGHIIVDQFGYRMGDDKVAVIVNPQEGFNSSDKFQPGSRYQVRRQSDGRVVYESGITPWNGGKTHSLSGDKAWWFDFSPVGTPGEYYVYDVQNNVKSYDFKIGDDVYKDALYAALRMFYYQREGIAHKAPYAEDPWMDDAAWLGPGQDTEARDVFHKDDPSTARDMSGGWMDAGDTNKYVTFLYSPIHQLLRTYEANPEFFSTFNLNIPESGNTIPDILDEIKWGMDWLTKMQNPDGSAYLKVGLCRENAAARDATSPPSLCAFPRYYLGIKSSAAAIDLAGMFAHGALVYEKIPGMETYAADLKARAISSWEWYQTQVAKDTRNFDIDNSSPADTSIMSGDSDLTAEQQDAHAVNAAIYLYALTGESSYNDYVIRHYTDSFIMQFSGDDPHSQYWGFYTGSAYDNDQRAALLFYATLSQAEQSVKSAILNKISGQAEANSSNQFLWDGNLNPYRAYVPRLCYHWGSNDPINILGGHLADLVNYNINPVRHSDYKKRAVNILHYAHGVNPLNMTFLTNMGRYGAEKSAMYMYHEWFRQNSPWHGNSAPGYLVGGVNLLDYYGNDPFIKAQPDMKAYKDDYFDQDYSVNEPMCKYQATYIELVANFVGKSSGSAPETEPVQPPADVASDK